MIVQKERLLCTAGIDTEGDEAVIGVIGKRVNHHGEYHDDVLTSLHHREEGDDVVGEVLPAESFKQNPADTELQSKADKETAHEQEELTLQVVLGLEHPIAVPQKTVNDTQNIARHVRYTIRKAKSGV